MKRILHVFIAFIFLSATTNAQEPAVDWQKVLNTDGNTTFFDLQKTSDNKFLLAGSSDMLGGYYENARILVPITVVGLLYKIDSTGNSSLFYYTPPGSIANFYAVAQTPAGKFIGGGYHRFDGGDGNVMIDQISSAGVREWWKLLGGTQEDKAFDLKLTNDNGLIFAGYTTSNDGNVSGNHGNGDVWIGKTDLSGNLLWQKCLGGAATDTAYSITQLVDGSYVIAGTTRSNDGDVTSNAGNADAWLVKLDAAGNLLWQKTFGGSGNDGFRKLQVTADGGFIALGYTESNNGIVTNNHGNSDVWVVKCDNAGNLQWQKCYGGSRLDRGADIKPVDGGGYIINSLSTSFDGDVRKNYGATDQWVIKIMDNGVIEWGKTIGTTKDELATAVLPINQHQFIAAGNQINSYEEYTVVTKLAPLNAITGNVFIDLDNNGIKDAGEPFYNSAIVKSVRTDGFTKSSGVTDGVFYNGVEPGTYETSISFSNPYFTASPLTHTSTFTGYLGNDQFDFRLVPNVTINDLQVSILPLSAARPGFAASYRVHYKNAGTTTLSNVTLELQKDSRVNIASTNPTYQSLTGNTVSWNIGTVPIFGEGDIYIYVQVQTPPTVNNGDRLLYSVKIIPPVTDNTPADNIDTLLQVVTGSFDPNDKTETHGGVITAAQVSGDEALTYLIRFQNTGTDTAFNITVRDTLDARLDWNSLQMIASSHTNQLSITDGNKLSWQFNDIKLPYTGIDEPNSHGYIAYSIKPKSTVVPGDTIKNTAGIYFDYNLPIATNTEKTAVLLLSPLPVTLTLFQAAEESGAVNVKWATSIEEHVKQFEVLRSSNGTDFITIGTVQPGKSSYLFTDKQPLKGYNYYRLRSVDADGTFSLSTIVLVNLKNGADIVSSLYPNPATGNATLKLQGTVEGNVLVQVLDQQGRLVTTKQFGVQHTAAFKTPLDLGQLAKGNYVLRIIVNDKTYLHKLLIQ